MASARMVEAMVRRRPAAARAPQRSPDVVEQDGGEFCVAVLVGRGEYRPLFALLDVALGGEVGGGIGGLVRGLFACPILIRPLVVAQQ